jgi:hypothetical protein
MLVVILQNLTFLGRRSKLQHKQQQGVSTEWVLK